jgi:hypothetical protein
MKMKLPLSLLLDMTLSSFIVDSIVKRWSHEIYALYLFFYGTWIVYTFYYTSVEC